MGGLLVAAAVVLAAFATAAMAGFGASVVALTLGAHVEPIAWWVPRLLPINICLMVYLTVRHRAHVRWRLLLRELAPLMALGAVVGFALVGRLSGPLVQVLFGAFVVTVSARALLGAAGVLPERTTPLPRPARALALVGAGVMQGLYLSGGPLLAFALSSARLPKSHFRSTLAAVWLTLNPALLAAFVLDDRVTASTLQDSLLLFPAVILAVVVGEWAHNRVDEARFRVVVNGLLLVAGLALLF